MAQCYGVSQGTLIHWVRLYQGMSASEIAHARDRHGPVPRMSDVMYGIKPQYPKPSKKSPGPHKISGWRVTLYRRQQAFFKIFRRADYSSARAALRAAQAWRDSVVATHRTPHKRAVASRLNSTNTSGVSGVSRLNYKRKCKDGSIAIYPVWLTRKPLGLPGGMTCRSFSIARHGDDEAFRLAVKARKAWEAQLRGEHAHHPGVARVYTLAGNASK